MGDLETVPTVVNRMTGDVLAVPTAETADLAAYLADLADIRVALADEQALVEVELLARLDRRGVWTWRVDGDGRGFTVKAASPTAGTTDYQRDILRTELARLVEDGAIEPEAARAALRRTITVTATFDVTAELEGIAAGLERTTGIGGNPVFDVTVTCAEKVQAAGVKRLERMGGEACAAVIAARREVDPPARRVKVETHTRQQGVRRA